MPDLTGAWQVQQPATLALAALATGYARGAATLARGARPLPGLRLAAFAAGLAALAAALLSPLDALAESLFSAHMAQHMLLVVVAAPLLAAGRPALALLLALPRAARRRLGRVRRLAPVAAAVRAARQPLPALGAFALVLWAWHLPVPYQAALASPWLHAAEHGSFLAAAWLLWSRLPGFGGHGTVGRGGAVLALFVTALQSAALGAVITLAPRPLYPEQARLAATLGVRPLADQQLAGLLMWVPADVAFLGAAGWQLARWLAELERQAPRGDRTAVAPLPTVPGGSSLPPGDPPKTSTVPSPPGSHGPGSLPWESNTSTVPGYRGRE